MLNKNIEVEGNELLLENGAGDKVIIPKNKASQVKNLLKEGKHAQIDEIVNTLPVMAEYAEDGTVVSALYKQKTGKDWSTAKEEGLTDGSYENNMKLRQRLISGEFDNTIANSSSKNNNEGTIQGIQKNQNLESISIANNFSEAFKIARGSLGPNQIFEYQGRKYGTNLKGEKFEPSEKVLKDFGLNIQSVKKRLENQNRQVVSPYTSKEVAKLEPEYKDWEKMKKRNVEINKMSNADKIISMYKGKDNEQYLVVDKKNARMHLYRGDKKIDSFEIGVGKNKSDAQTVTKVIDRNKDGKITEADKPYKVDWEKGNKSTGAGIYTISNVDPESKSYYNLPAFNLANEQGIEVSTAIHGTPSSRRKYFDDKDVNNNRMSYGCINGVCTDLKTLYKEHGLKKGDKVYILPEDEGNSFELVDGKIVMRMSAKNRKKYLSYEDSQGNIQKGQGGNYTTKTLVHKPIKIVTNKTEFEKNVYQATDFDDDVEYKNNTKPFVQSLVNNKKKVMQTVGIPSDVYNEIVKVALGIYGTETNFGDTHSPEGNLLRAANKYFSPSTSSSPDYLQKATTYGANKDTNSVGLTQIRFSQLNEKEKAALKKVGITKNMDFMLPDKAALGTAIVLGIRYNEQLTPEQKKDIMTYLPTKWNTRSNYSDRVKSNSSYFTIQQLD